MRKPTSRADPCVRASASAEFGVGDVAGDAGVPTADGTGLGRVDSCGVNEGAVTGLAHATSRDRKINAVTGKERMCVLRGGLLAV